MKRLLLILLVVVILTGCTANNKYTFDMKTASDGVVTVDLAYKKGYFLIHDDSSFTVIYYDCPIARGYCVGESYMQEHRTAMEAEGVFQDVDQNVQHYITASSTCYIVKVTANDYVMLESTETPELLDNAYSLLSFIA